MLLPKPHHPRPQSEIQKSPRGQMGGGGLVGAYSPVTKYVCSALTESPGSPPPLPDADAEHTPSPVAHTQNPTPQGECCCHQTWFTNLMKILPVGPKKLRESTLCSQVSDVAYKNHHPKSRPRKTPPFVSFLGRQYRARGLVQVLALVGLAFPL